MAKLSHSSIIRQLSLRKTILFQFVNSFASLYYLAFVKEQVEGCFFENNFTAELSLHLPVIFISFIAFNAVEIAPSS